MLKQIIHGDLCSRPKASERLKKIRKSLKSLNLQHKRKFIFFVAIALVNAPIELKALFHNQLSVSFQFVGFSGFG